MNYIKKAVTTLGGIFLAALLIAALAPKATRGIAAALVQVVNNVPVVNPLDANGNAIPLQADADRGARNSFFALCVTNTSLEGDFGSCNLMTVPAGKIAVVETVSGHAFAKGSNQFVEVVIAAIPSTPGTSLSFDLALTSTGFDGTYTYFLFNNPTKFYAPSGSTINGSLATGNDFSGQSAVLMEISGYYVPAN